MLPSMDDCNECRPAYLQRRLDSFPPSTIALSSAPFALTFLVTAVAVWQKVVPHLSSSNSPKDQNIPFFNRESSRSNNHGLGSLRNISFKSIAAVTFSATISLSAVLVELILCEISNLLNPAARGLALRITLFSLLILIIIVIPSLEVHSLVTGSRSRSEIGTQNSRKSRPTLRYTFEAFLLGIWFVAFWYMPHTSLLPASLHSQAGHPSKEKDFDFVEACLERVGIIGISLMASLAGFAAVSSIWQTFGVRHRAVRDTDISRKESGLAATRDMLAVKQSRLRALQRKMSEAPQDKGGIMTRMIGSIKGNSDTNEQRSLEMEISGLETMSMTLASSLATIKTRYAIQQRSQNSLGRLLNMLNFGFAIYCLYRIAATSISSMRRWWQPDATFATSDPINNVLALLTTHYDPTLDREAWSRQISFVLSGVMLLLSFNAVLQTFRLFTRFFPSLAAHAQSALPLVISQIAGAYVISSALLLRSNLPSEVSSVISEALGAPLEGRFVEAWFESWFLVAVVLTSIGILISRKVGSSADWEDWEDNQDTEMGKLH
ncbi:hypothetical protein D6C86_07530 [Aureobasidium pullulans]|uniref:Uncharacterized protein n=1 Tax=Aureobasidium pullulans TaxID=5580 RepID=A0A4S9VW73_AURPU|nr:hypothetical protein D6C94_07987 [Aureobasidium pullulans]THZ42775.1 hypothetical protein D6C87_04775 [Aureobasidium pullulans]THZ56819.1 hypothetical protein D6C88_09205 [Aureobasidium pullulans]THZ56847.1 hypothetical protein D6C86_07530 [Aureobasidium pullulans]TIA30152.1 hypothetical protein D6C79_09742 [Aureobasidium pullulans]